MPKNYEEIDARFAERFVRVVDFDAVRATVAELDRAEADDHWERFCGSGRPPRQPVGLDGEVCDRITVAGLRRRAAQGGIG